MHTKSTERKGGCHRCARSSIVLTAHNRLDSLFSRRFVKTPLRSANDGPITIHRPNNNRAGLKVYIWVHKVAVFKLMNHTRLAKISIGIFRANILLLQLNRSYLASDRYRSPERYHEDNQKIHEGSLDEYFVTVCVTPALSWG